MRRMLYCLTLVLLCVSSTASAQDVAGRLAEAERHVAAKKWSAALSALSALETVVESPADRERVAGRLYDLGDAALAAGAPADALRAYVASLAGYQRVHGEEAHPSVALCRNNVGVCLLHLQRASEAAEPLAAALAMQERLYGGDHPFLVQTLQNLAACLLDVGRPDEALARSEAALSMLHRLDAAAADLAEAHALVGRCLRSLGRVREALPHCEEALSIRRRLHGDADHVAVATAIHEAAYCLEMVGRVDEALAHNEAALAMRLRLFGENQDSTATSLNNVATCLAKAGRLAEALVRYEEALSIRQALAAGADSQDVAASLGNVAGCLTSLGRPADALPKFEASLAMRQRLHGNVDHHDLVWGEVGVGHCLRAMDRTEEALPRFERALAMCRRLYADTPHADTAMALAHAAGCHLDLGQTAEGLAGYEQVLELHRRLHGGHDHPLVAQALGNVATCLHAAGRDREALAASEAALAMNQRLHGDGAHPDVAAAENGVGASLVVLGRPDDAVPHLERALAIHETVFGSGDHPLVAMALDNLGGCLAQVGRLHDALLRHEAAVAMRQRLFGGADQRDVAHGLDRVASCLLSLGRVDEALPRLETALAMRRRLHADGDHPDVAMAWNDLGMCFSRLGRHPEALACAEAALGIVRRLHAGADHPNVADALAGVAGCLQSLGRDADALPLHEAAAAMVRRLHPDGDHPAVAMKENNLGACLQRLGRPADALPLLEGALSMCRRLSGGQDRPEAALFLDNVARCEQSLGRDGEALRLFEEALAMGHRLYGDVDHPDLAWSHGRLGSCLAALGRTEEALAALERSCGIAERVRDRARLGGSSRQAFFDVLKGRGSFEELQALAARAGRAAQALHAAERSRGREMQDLEQQQRFDPIDEAERRARLRGDDAAAGALVALRSDLEEVELADAHVLHELSRTAGENAKADATRTALVARARELAARRRQLLDARARLCGDVLDAGRVRSPDEVRATLQQGELLLELTIAADRALLYVVARDQDVEAIEVPLANTTVTRVVSKLLPEAAAQPTARGRDPDGTPGTPPEAVAASHELFTSLIPPRVWERLQRCRRVFLAAHRELHRLPFERLVTDVADGKPVYWLDAGPPISYVPSGSALHWLRRRGRDAGDDATAIDVLAVGDPRRLEAEPPLPEHGAFVVEVAAGGEGARLGLLPGDVLTSYDGQPLVDDKTLRDRRMETEKAVEDGRRERAPIPIEVWRRGKVVKCEAQPGLLGIRVGPGTARLAREAALDNDARMHLVTRAGDLERLDRLPPLRGARAETEAIAAVFAGRRAVAKTLVGTEATEPAVFELARKAKYVHFACHGIAEEYAGQSLSMLVLAQPTRVLPNDDGFLRLSDLFHAWRGRLASCRLVVLSACRTNVGPTYRDEAPQALPLGFLFAGAPAVISTLWAVDDASTKELMTDFYGRLLAGETDQLAAFTAAKKALRAKYPDPFHWAPFLYMGSPE